MFQSQTQFPLTWVRLYGLLTYGLSNHMAEVWRDRSCPRLKGKLEFLIGHWGPDSRRALCVHDHLAQRFLCSWDLSFHANRMWMDRGTEGMGVKVLVLLLRALILYSTFWAKGKSQNNFSLPLLLGHAVLLPFLFLGLIPVGGTGYRGNTASQRVGRA